MNAAFFNKKKERRTKLKKQYGLLQKDKALGLIKISNKELIKDLRDGLLTIPSGFIFDVEGIENDKIGKNIVATGNINEDDLIGFDFIVCDDDISNIDLYLKNGITPLILQDNHFTSILKEFNPLKNEGNAFFYECENKWCIFASIVKYLENYKFPFDNKNLVKNVLSV